MKITAFYIVYYAFLTAFFIVMLLAFFQTVDDKMPTWRSEAGGLIGKNPAMGFRPGPPDSNIESTLIWFREATQIIQQTSAADNSSVFTIAED